MAYEDYSAGVCDPICRRYHYCAAAAQNYDRFDSCVGGEDVDFGDLDDNGGGGAAAQIRIHPELMGICGLLLSGKVALQLATDAL